MTEPTKPPRAIRRVNRGQVADLLGVALTTVDAMVRAGMPVIDRPGRGKPTVFDLLAVLRWRYERQTVAATEDPEKLEPRDRKAWYEGEAKRREIAERDAELIPAAEAQAAVTAAHGAITAVVQAIPGELQDRADLTDEQVRDARKILGEALVDLTDRLAPYAPGLTAS
jgi:phage terminase Nu1 subunit (DNA packaging protein)